MYQLTITLGMNVLSNILGNFISVVFALIVFQQEIKFGTIKVDQLHQSKKFLRYFNFLSLEEEQIIKLRLFLFANA